MFVVVIMQLAALWIAVVEAVDDVVIAVDEDDVEMAISVFLFSHVKATRTISLGFFG